MWTSSIVCAANAAGRPSDEAFFNLPVAFGLTIQRLPTIYTGVVHKRWFHGGGLRVDEKGRLEGASASPPPQPFLQFGHILIFVQVEALVLQASP